MHKFNPENIHRLEDPERRSWQDPDFILERIGLKEGMVFADIGCGSGWFVVSAARMTGAKGWVHAMDLQPPMLEAVQQKVSAFGLDNVTLHLCEEIRFPLSNDLVDLALLANVFHELEHQGDFLREILRTMKPGANLAILEWKKEESPIGPPIEEKVTEDEIENALLDAGFDVVDLFYPGPYHVCYIGQKGPAAWPLSLSASA